MSDQAYGALIALIAIIPSTLVFVNGLRTQKKASGVRVYTIDDRLLEDALDDAADLRLRLREAEQSLRECLNQVPRRRRLGDMT